MTSRRYRTIGWLVVLSVALWIGGACSGGTSGDGTSPTDGSRDAGGGEGDVASPDSASNASETTRFQTRTNDEPADWSCLNDVTWAQTSASELEYTGRAIDVFGGESMSGVGFEICPDASNASCEEPVVSGNTNADGTFTGTLPMSPTGEGFDGYARVSGEGSAMETLIFFNPPITENEGAPVEIPLLSQMMFERLMDATMGVDPKPERGHLALEALDCTWRRTSGVTFEINTADDQTTAVYLSDGLPTTSVSATDATGLGGFVNVPPGRVTVTATDNETGTQIGSVQVFVEAGAISEVAVAPKPASPTTSP